VDGRTTSGPEAIRLSPDFAAAYYNRGTGRLEKNDFRGAREDYDRAIELNPEHADAWSNRAGLRRLAGDPAGAAEDATVAVRLDPRCAHSWCTLGLARTELGDHEAAVTAFTQAIDIAPDWRFHQGRGCAKHNARDHAGARRDFDEAIRLAPDDARNYYLRSLSAHELGDHEAGIADCTAALDRDATLLEAYVSRANCLVPLARIPAAIADLEECLRRAPDTWPLRPQIEAFRARLRP
jgi:tetratricopeptide (TPR) repeat protein